MTAGVSFLRDLSSCIRSLSAWKEASGKGWELLTGWGQAWQGSLIPGDGAQVPPTPGARDVGEAERRQITEDLIISEGGADALVGGDCWVWSGPWTSWGGPCVIYKSPRRRLEGKFCSCRGCCEDEVGAVPVSVPLNGSEARPHPWEGVLGFYVPLLVPSPGPG